MTAPDPAPGPLGAPDPLPASPDSLEGALRQERAHHDRCRATLAAMVDGADEQVVIGADASASGADAEVLGYQLRSRAQALRELPEGPLFFGRLDFRPPEKPADPDGHPPLHVGRLRIGEHPAAPPLVVDWRAPVARAFYQAGPADPHGVAVRRRFGWAPGSRGDSADLTSLEDEHLDPGDPRAGPAGPSAIVAREIERPRVGPMRDIAATIQPDQDALVRGDLARSVCVQGAPGTGKTAVGLHRAAYLLYTHPQRLRRGGLLILGPHRTFLDYIAAVLPALGESGVRQSTLREELAEALGHPAGGGDDEDPRAAALKHDERMAEVLRRALYARVDPAAVESLTVPDGAYRWRVTGAEVAETVAGVRAEEPPYETGRERVRTRLVERLRRSAERRSGPRPAPWARKVGRALTPHLDAVWPRVRPEEVVAGLLGDPEALARAADGVFDGAERRALHRSRLSRSRLSRSWRSVRWSDAELVMLDEVAGLIAHPDGYAHVVVDEAQDLSPMECRAIARRARFGSLTVLGDLAQGTTAWAARSWTGSLRHLGVPDADVVPLTTGFRVPAGVVGLANRLLARLDVDVPAGRSLRTDGEVRIRAADGDLPGAVVAAVREATAGEGSIGVVAADGDTGWVRAALEAAGVPVAAAPLGGGAGERVTVVAASGVKGLEYDHVVAVEPAAIAEAEERGLHRLYVVLTRAVSRLDVVHGRPLPF
ncbi:HelD family protein [Streptomyces sp. NPDC088789]|uniref:HelD family protein n=1 Tax=Streptomyces sp. NPDC088789 TaxID=3365899 RepID=UPI003830E8E3